MVDENAPPEARLCPEGPEELYLTLLKKCLTRYLFHDQWRPVQPHPSRKQLVVLYAWLQKLLASQNLVLMRPQPFDEEFALNGGPWKARYSSAETMIGLHRLGQLQNSIVDVIRNQVPGDLIEAGAWRGGATIFMRAVLKAYRDTTRSVWVADSFSGLPPRDAASFPQDAGFPVERQQHMVVSLDEVKRNFARYDLLDDRVRFLAGWFRDTLPTAPIKRLALIRLDGVLYESTMEALKYLYPKLSSGGYVIIDDYYTPHCTAAVDDFRRDHHITEPLQVATWPRWAVYWQCRS